MIIRIYWWQKYEKVVKGMCIKCSFLVEKNILVRNFADFINENPQFINILYT